MAVQGRVIVMKLNILIVEKNIRHRICLNRICKLIEEVGAVVCVSDLEEAERWLKEKRFDLLFLNLERPCQEVVRRAGVLRRLYPGLRVGFTFSQHEITLQEANQCALEAYQIQAFTFLEKPYKQREVLTAIGYRIEMEKRELKFFSGKKSSS